MTPSEAEANLHPRQRDTPLTQSYRRWQQKTADVLRARTFHKIILALIVLDATFGIIDLGYVLVHPICKGNIHENENPLWLEVLGRVSLAITSLFLLEIPFTMWALGFQWFIPFGPVQHASLHLFDAIVIVTTFVLEVVLRPRESELAGLLIILRLWRIVKVVAAGAEELDEQRKEELRHLQGELEKTRAELVSSRQEISRLEKRTGAATEDDPPISMTHLNG